LFALRALVITITSSSKSDIVFTLRIGLENSDEPMRVYSYENGFELCQKLLEKDVNLKVCFMTSGEINIDAVREVHPFKSVGCFIKKPLVQKPY